MNYIMLAILKKNNVTYEHKDATICSKDYFSAHKDIDFDVEDIKETLEKVHLNEKDYILNELECDEFIQKSLSNPVFNHDYFLIELNDNVEQNIKNIILMKEII